MKHHTTSRFWENYQKLPDDVKTTADKNFALLNDNPSHPSLHFKKVNEFWSARIGLSHRALAMKIPEGFYGFGLVSIKSMKDCWQKVVFFRNPDNPLILRIMVRTR